MELDIAILPGCDGSLQRKRNLRVDIGRLGRCKVGCGGRVHVGRVELGHHHGVGPGRVRDAQPQYAILETSPGIDRGEPIEGLVSLLVGIAVTPVDRLFLYFYRPGLYLQPLGLADALACY